MDEKKKWDNKKFVVGVLLGVVLGSLIVFPYKMGEQTATNHFQEKFRQHQSSWQEQNMDLQTRLNAERLLRDERLAEYEATKLFAIHETHGSKFDNITFRGTDTVCIDYEEKIKCFSFEVS